MFIVEDREPKVIMSEVEGEMKNCDKGFNGSIFLSFFCFDFEIWGICFYTSENITGGYKSMFLIFKGLGLAFSPGIYFSGINNYAPRLEILSQMWLVKSDILIPFSAFV